MTDTATTITKREEVSGCFLNGTKAGPWQAEGRALEVLRILHPGLVRDLGNQGHRGVGEMRNGTAWHISEGLRVIDAARRSPRCQCRRYQLRDEVPASR